MLFELYLEFENGTKEKQIVFTNPGERVTIYPQRDKIVSSDCKRLIYKVEKHPYLCKSIVRFHNKTMIYPAAIECHPQTTLDDIIELETEPTVLQSVVQEKPIEKQKWTFESSSGGGTYTVKYTKNGKLSCDCPGVWRSKDRKCKHIRQIEDLEN